MGGNVIINNVSADKINLNKIDRLTICDELYHSFTSIDKYYQSRYNQQLFELTNLLDILSGSSKFLFDTLITIEDLLQYKPIFGDIDIMVNKQSRTNLTDFLAHFEGVTFGKLRLIGYKQSNSQLITIWTYITSDINIQIDFEFVDFENNKPTNWSKFNHSSDWNDTKSGIKGCFHKYLLQSIAGYKKQEMIVLTGRKQTPKSITKSIVAFSVTHGLRTRFVQNQDNTWTELSTSESNNITEPQSIFEELFPIENYNVSYLYSFTGLLKLLELMNKEVVQLIIEDFKERIFGSSSQQLVRNDVLEDLRIKNIALELLINCCVNNHK